MNNRKNVLLVMLVVTAILVIALGCYLKYVVLVPFELYQEDSVIAVPFLLMADKPALENIRLSMTPTEPTEPQIEAPTESPTEAPTQPAIDDVTEEPTEAPTEAPTEPIVIDESWFDDVLFIGDSRTKSMAVTRPLGKAHYFCDHGLSVFDVRHTKCHSKDFYSTRLDGLLTQFTYGKIYIMLGINGMYMPHDDIIAEYVKLIDLIQELQPDAVIVLNGIMTVGRVKAAAKDYSLENIYGLNEKIAELADNEKIFYIDINEFIADEEGYLPDEMSRDGVHFYADHYSLWAEWLIDSAATLGIR